MPTVSWLPQASRDIEKQYNFLRTENEDAAKKAVKTILQAGNSLSDNPYRGTVIEDQAGLRKLRVFFGKYGYVIHYAVIADEVLILRVYHGRENRPF